MRRPFLGIMCGAVAAHCLPGCAVHSQNMTVHFSTSSSPLHCPAPEQALPAVETLKLGRLQPLTAAGAAAAISLMPRLRRLDLTGSALKDGGLVGGLAASLPASLSSLSLRECCSLSDAGLAGLLAALPALQEADLSMCSQLGDGTLAQLGRCPQLAKLDLTGCERFRWVWLGRLQGGKGTGNECAATQGGEGAKGGALGSRAQRGSCKQHAPCLGLRHVSSSSPPDHILGIRRCCLPNLLFAVGHCPLSDTLGCSYRPIQPFPLTHPCFIPPPCGPRPSSAAARQACASCHPPPSAHC